MAALSPGKMWTYVEIHSSTYAFLAVDRTTNDAFCWDYSSYGGACPTGKTWTYVEIHSTRYAFLAVDRTTNDAFCWGDSADGEPCPTGKMVFSTLAFQI
jgi:hypothetical protein